MKLRGFSEEDITDYALKHGGRNIRNVYKEIEKRCRFWVEAPIRILKV